MRIRPYLFATLLFVFLIQSCNGPSSQPDLHRIVGENNEKLKGYFLSGDADALAAMYTDSAKLMPNKSEAIMGREAIREFWRHDMGVVKLQAMETQTKTVDGNEHFIYETGKTTSHVLYQDSIYVVSVKFINVWKRQQDGSYQLDVDMWNSLE